jgi:transposase-like protein
VVPTKRRQFTDADKLRILDEVDRCDPGQIGAILRREGLYSSHLSQWRRQRANGQLAGLTSQPRGRKAVPQAAELAALRRENERLQAELEQAKLIIEVQKKLCQRAQEIIASIADHISDPELRASFLNLAEVQEVLSAL